MVKKMLNFKNLVTDSRLVNLSVSIYMITNERRILIVVISILFLLLFLSFVVPVLLFYLYAIFYKNFDFQKKV